MKQIGKTLYIISEKAYIHCSDFAIEVKIEDRKLSIGYDTVSDIIFLENAVLSAYVVYQCNLHGISISYVSPYGRYLGGFVGPKSGNVMLRQKQYQMLEDSIDYIRTLIGAKTKNQIWLLKYLAHHNDYKDQIVHVVDFIQKQRGKLKAADCIDEIRNIEAICASRYYSVFDLLIKTDDMKFERRSKRPPENNVNALLSLFYTLTTSMCTSALLCRGLDPECGYLHVLRSGRNSLACDLVEEFRSVVVDRFVITMINRKEVLSSDFLHENDGIRLKKDSMKVLLGKWDQYLLKTEVEHKLYSKKMNLKYLFYEQAQLLAQYIRGDLKQYPAFIMVN